MENINWPEHNEEVLEMIAENRALTRTERKGQIKCIGPCLEKIRCYKRLSWENVGKENKRKI